MTAVLRLAPRLAALALLPLLAACASMLGGGGAPSTLYGLQAPQSFPAAAGPTAAWQLTVEEPIAERALDTDRIAIYTTPHAIQYFPAARWSDRAPRLVQDLMVESFELAGHRLAAGRATVGVRPDYVLVTELRDFEARLPEGGGAPVSAIRLSAKLVAIDGRRVVDARSFQASEQAASDSVADVVRALDAASQQVMREIVGWTVAAAAPGGES